MADHHDIELAEDASATEHGAKKETSSSSSSIAVKWAFNGNWRRFRCAHWTFDALMAEIRNVEPNFYGQLFYRDSDGDAILFSTDAEMHVMLDYFRNKLNKDTVAIETETSFLPSLFAQCPAFNNTYDMANKEAHPNIICDSCDRSVVGIRYKCFVCPDFDLCELCEKKGAHGEHAMCRLATADTPRPLGLPRPPLNLAHCKTVQDYLKQMQDILKNESSKRLTENNQKIAAKLEKIERKHARHVAKREQRLQDRAARAQHRLERSMANKMSTLAAEIPVGQQRSGKQPPPPPSAPPAGQVGQQHRPPPHQPKKNTDNNTAVGQQNQQPLHGHVDYLLGIGQSVQRALMNFGIECDAEVRDENGVLHGAVPYVHPTANNATVNGNDSGTRQHTAEKTISANRPIFVDHPMTKDGILQRRQLCGASVPLRTTAANPPNSANSSSSHTPSAPPQSRHAVDQAALMTAIAKAQETVKKSLPVALSGLEATSAAISEFLGGFDPSTGQAANRVGQSVMDTARQSVENLTEKYLGPEFLTSILQLPTVPPVPLVVPPVPPTPTIAQSIDKLNELHAQLESMQINKDGDRKDLNKNEKSNGSSKLNTLADNGNAKNDQETQEEAEIAKSNVVGQDTANEEGPREDDDSVTSIAPDTAAIISGVETTNSLDKQQPPPASPVQLGNKRKLGDGMYDLMKLSTHQSTNAEDVDLDMSSVSSRSSAATLSSTEDEEDSAGGDGWMMVKKESFKKLCDFYEKRRRLECDGGTVAADPFAAQLEREFREAMTTANANCENAGGENGDKTESMPSSKETVEPKKADDTVVVDGQLAPVEVAQIVDLSAEKNETKKQEKSSACAHAVVMRGVCAGCGQDFRQPNELIGHSATISNFEQQQKSAQGVDAVNNKQQPFAGDDNQTAQQRIYPLLDTVPDPGFLSKVLGQPVNKCTNGDNNVCTAGVSYAGYQKPIGMKHSRQCEWKHKNIIFQNVVNQLVDMGFDNCNGWLFRVVEQNGIEMDRIFAAIDQDPIYRARVSIQ